MYKETIRRAPAISRQSAPVHRAGIVAMLFVVATLFVARLAGRGDV